MKVKNATKWNNTSNRYELDANPSTVIEEAKDDNNNLFEKMDHKIMQIKDLLSKKSIKKEEENTQKK